MAKLSLAVNAEDHILGPLDAPITLVEYGSYDCPHCRQALAILLTILKERNEYHRVPVRLVYRHFPRELLHSESHRAAEAAEAAGGQGKFWEMHRHILENQHELEEASLLADATLLNLDIQRFAADLEAHTYSAKVQRDQHSGVESGVHSTPTFFINGIRHDDYWDIETLLAAIDNAQLE